MRMRERIRFRAIGLLAAVGTLAAMAVTMALAAPGGAATAEEEYTTSFNTECVVAPGVLNIKDKPVHITLRGNAPDLVREGEEFTFHNVSATIEAPTESSNSFVELGANEVRGRLTHMVLDVRGAEPAVTNIAKPPEYPAGLPFYAPVTRERAVVFNLPSKSLGETGLTYTAGSWTVKGAVGGQVELALGQEPGYLEPEAGVYRETGEGIIAEYEGTKNGEHVIGPLKLACNSPGTLAVRIPVASPPTETTTTTTTTTTTCTCTQTVKVLFQDWKLKGSLTDKKLGQAITLPEGCTFNGEAEVPGPFEADTACPPLSTSVKILGVLRVKLGLTLTQAEPVKGSFSAGPEGKLLIKGAAKEKLGITSVSLLGLTIPTSCASAAPIVFALETEAPARTLVSGIAFNGETKLPPVKCGGGLLGSLFGPILTALMSGPGNPFTLTIEP